MLTCGPFPQIHAKAAASCVSIEDFVDHNEMQHTRQARGMLHTERVLQASLAQVKFTGVLMHHQNLPFRHLHT